MPFFFFLFVNLVLSQGQSSFLKENELQIQRRKHNTDPAQNKSKKKPGGTKRIKTEQVLVFLASMKFGIGGSFDDGGGCGGGGGADDPSPHSQIAKSSRNKNRAASTTAPLLDNRVVCRNRCGPLDWSGLRRPAALGCS